MNKEQATATVAQVCASGLYTFTMAVPHSAHGFDAGLFFCYAKQVNDEHEVRAGFWANNMGSASLDPEKETAVDIINFLEGNATTPPPEPTGTEEELRADLCPGSH